jgi:hypothetical protein
VRNVMPLKEVVGIGEYAGPDGIARLNGLRFRWGVKGKRPPHISPPQAP